MRDFVRMALATIGLSAGWGPSIVDAKDVRFFSIEERRNGPERVLHLDGLVFHSSLAVERVDLSYEGDAVIVEVRLTPAGNGLSGSFVTDVSLHAETKRVLFGPTRQQIWPPLDR